ncbi:radical SAM protein (plasmid) [Macrococcoides canis]|uniref:radical SAM/SPASM domain-containing protein n=1 Tax=Macrococcoides canis TaxID=1855823 RepID=UPI001F41D4F2|nr:radical SAM protein [Macrococcus canis]UJS29031.1 radical SAM protein [Macrococcus canis]
MFKLSDDYLIRREFFGGLAIILGGGEYELDEISTEILLFFENSNNIHQLKYFLNEAMQIDINIEEINNILTQLEIFLEPTSLEYKLDDVDRYISSMLVQRNSINNTNYLSAPLSLSIYPNMKCNLSCSFCFISDEKWDDENIYYDAEKWIKVIKQAKNMRVPYLTILGGEPLMYRGIWDILDYTKKLNIRTHITTNGTINSNSVIQKLKQYNNLTIKVSLQSLDEFHNKETKGDFNQPIKFLKRLKDNNIDCGIHTVGLKGNFRKAEEILKFCEENNINDFSMGIFFNINKVDIEEFSLVQYREKNIEIQNLINKKYPNIKYRLEGCQNWTAEPTLKEESIPRTPFEIIKSGCDAAQSRLEVMNDGVLLGCALFNKHRHSAGNVFKDDLSSLWKNSKEFEKLRNFKTKDNDCKSCNFNYFCNGGCPAMNEKYNDTIYAGDERCNFKQNIKDMRNRNGII